MLGRKIFSTFIASICIVLILATITVISDDGVSFGALVFVYSIYVVPVVFVYGILTSSLSELYSIRYMRFTNAVSLGLHIIWGLVFFVPFNLLMFHELMAMDIGFLLVCGLFGGAFFCVDCIVKYFWDNSPVDSIDEKPSVDYSE